MPIVPDNGRRMPIVPDNGQRMPIVPDNGQRMPIVPDNGRRMPIVPDNGRRMPIVPDNGRRMPIVPDNGQRMPIVPDNGQRMPIVPDNGNSSVKKILIYDIKHIFKQIYQILNNKQFKSKSFERINESELKRSKNRIGTFTVDPYNFVLAVLKIEQATNLSFSDIAGYLLTILYKMEDITTTYEANIVPLSEEHESGVIIDKTFGLNKLPNCSRIRAVLNNLAITDCQYISESWSEFGTVTAYDGEKIQLQMTAGLNMAVLIFMKFIDVGDKTIYNMDTDYNISLYGENGGNCSLYSKTLSTGLNNKELLTRLKIFGPTFNVRDNFHRICLMFNITHYIYKQEFSYGEYSDYVDVLDILKYYYISCLSPAEMELYERFNKVYVCEQIDKPVTLRDLYINNKKYFKLIDLELDESKNEANIEYRTENYKFIKLDHPIQAVEIYTSKHAFSAYINKDKVIISDNNNTSSESSMFELSDTGLIEAILFIEKYTIISYGYRKSLFSSTGQDEFENINNMFYTFIHNDERKDFSHNIEDIGVTLFNLICLFRQRHCYVTVGNAIISSNDECRVLLTNSNQLYDVKSGKYVCRLEDDEDIQYANEIIKLICLQERRLYDYANYVKLKSIELIKDLCKQYDINITDMNILNNMQIPPSSAMVRHLGLSSVYLDKKTVMNSHMKPNYAAILKNSISITDDVNSVRTDMFDKTMSFKELCKQLIYINQQDMLPFNNDSIFKHVDDSINKVINDIISILSDKLINGHQQYDVFEYRNKMTLLFIIAYVNDITCKVINKYNPSQFIMDFTSVCPDIAEKIFGHECYMKTNDKHKRFRAKSMIKMVMHGGNELTSLIPLLIIIIVIIIIIIVIIINVYKNLSIN